MRQTLLALALLGWGEAVHPTTVPEAPVSQGCATAPSWTQSRIAFEEDLGLVFVSHHDAGRVVALDATNGYRRWEVRVDALPSMIDVLATNDGRQELLVSCEGSGEIWSLDPATGEVRYRLPVGKGPRGFAPLDGDRLAVALFLEHKVTIWNRTSRTQVAEAPIGRFPTHLYADSSVGSLYVARFFAGALDVLDLKTLTVADPLPVAFQANQISTMMTADGGKTLVIPHIIANTEQPDLHLANTVFPAVSFVPVDGRAPKMLNLALLGEVVNGPEALAILPRRELLLTVNSRSNDLSVIDLTTDLSAGLVEVGRYPLGVVVNRSEETAYVVNAFDHSISVIDVERRQEVAQWVYGEDALPAQIAHGRALFHDADSLRLVLNQWMSCSNCHPGGLSDGRVWRLPGKPPLRTKSLADFVHTRPGGWLATFDEMQDEEIFIREFFLGIGLSETAPHPHLGESNEGLSADLDALSAYVYSLRTTPSPFLKDGKLSEQATRGREIFFSEETGCTNCHPPPSYTISSLDGGRTVDNPIEPLLLEDTRAVLIEAAAIAKAEARLRKLDVPSLLGLYREPAFLHDGRAGTVGEIFARWNPSDRHGTTSHLNARALQDLEMFLLSLPYENANSTASEE